MKRRCGGEGRVSGVVNVMVVVVLVVKGMNESEQRVIEVICWKYRLRKSSCVSIIA